jgi:hypothetical protein
LTSTTFLAAGISLVSPQKDASEGAAGAVVLVVELGAFVVEEVCDVSSGEGAWDEPVAVAAGEVVAAGAVVAVPVGCGRE